MARSNQKKSIGIRDVNGALWSGQTVELKRGAATVLLTEVGTSGVYENASVPVGQWEVYVNSNPNGETVPVGAGEVDVPDASANPNSTYVTDEFGVPQLSDGTSAGGDLVVYQIGHGLAVNESIYHNGTDWQKAIADNVATLGTYIVSEVTDANNFKATKAGVITSTAHGLTVGEFYYTSSSTPGALVTVEPTISNPMIKVIDANTLEVLNYRPNADAVEDSESLVIGTESWIVFDTVANMKAQTLKNADTIDLSQYVGDLVRWSGYYAENDGGGNVGIIKDAVHTQDDGSIFTISGNIHVEALEPVKAKQWGIKYDGTTDAVTQYGKAVTYLSGIDREIYFEGAGTVFFAGSRPDLSGVKILTDEGITFKVDEDPNTKEMKLLSNVTIENPVHVTTFVKPASENIPLKELYNSAGLIDMAVDEVATVEDLTTWNQKVYILSTGDISSTNGTATVTSSQVTWASDFSSNPQVLYPTSISDGVFYEINAEVTTATNEGIGLFTKTSNRVWWLNTVEASNTFTIVEADFTGTVQSSTVYNLPNGSAYGWVDGEEINLGFIVEGTTTTALINGTPFYRFPSGSTASGFFFSTSGDYTNVTLRDCIKTTNYRTKAKLNLNIGVIGDSISYGAWCSNDIVDLLPSYIQNLAEIGEVEITNYAVSGTNSEYWATGTGSSTDYSSHDIVFCMIGTNDQQGSVATSTYLTNLGTIASNITGDGAEPIFGIFPIFTNASISGVTGVSTSNYEKHAKYTRTLKKFCIDNSHPFADMRRNIGANIGWYGDNIHPTVEGQIAIMGSWAEGISKYFRTKGGPLNV